MESHSPSREDLDALARDAAAAAAMTIISRSNDRYTRTIDSARAGHATLRLRIVDAAIALLTGPPETIAANQGLSRLRLVLSRRHPKRNAQVVQHGHVRQRREVTPLLLADQAGFELTIGRALQRAS